MNIEERVAELFRIRNTRKDGGMGWKDHASAYWKDGFIGIISGNDLILNKVINFCDSIKTKFPEFLRHFSEHDLRYTDPKSELADFYDLPFDRRYHLQFPLVKVGDNGRFLYTPYKEDNSTTKMLLPMVHIKNNLAPDFGPVGYDYEEPWRLDPELIIKSYELFKQLIDYAKV